MTQQWSPDNGVDRRTLLRGAAGLGLAAAGGTLLSACGTGGDDERAGAAPRARSGQGPALETTNIRMLAIPPATCFAGKYLAEPSLREQGFTDVQYTPFAAKDAWDRLAAGEADFGMGYAAAMIRQIDAGAPLVMLGGIHVGCWEIIATGDISSMRDFTGKTVAIVGPDFIDGMFLAMTLANVGLDLRKDVTLVNHPPTEFARVLSSGEVDAVLAFPPISTDLKAKGIGRVVLNSITDAPWSSYYCCTAVVNRDWMRKHPGATKAAMRAVLQGADLVAEDPKASAHHLVERGFTPHEGHARQSLKEIPYDIWRDFDQSDSVRFYSLRLNEAGIIDSTPEEIIKRGTDYSYLSDLKRELGAARAGAGTHAQHS
ncbi:MAG: ABC transporter substrate-binding protein [Sporichthyaceae bacterium]